jgi:chromosome segregation protein
LYLKEIEIKGFKSFANKIKLTITPGITVIVGPNGCGKSNITDAVRWILGEQNIRSLRGKNLTDMIFSGNKYQKMRNLAEVSILFDNVDRKLPIDTEQVELRRVIYRSGTTENYINGLPSKLKDIHELFYGTGLGKNSYSIIAQGKVDFVLNSKPSERRILFEEAANISSYNNKKESAIKKLDLVKNNLLRINDILLEVNENLSYYKKKANDLKAYQSYRDYIKKLEFYLLSQQYMLYEKNSIKYDKKLADLNHEIVKIENLIKENKRKIVQIEEKKEYLEKKLNDTEKCFQENEKENINYNNQLIVLKQKKSEISQRISSIYEDTDNANKQFIKFKDTISDIEKDIQETESNYKIITKNYAENNLLLKKYDDVFTCYSKIVSDIEDNNKTFANKYIHKYREEKIKEETIMKSLESSLLTTEKDIILINDKLIDNKKRVPSIEKNITYYENELVRLQKEKNKIAKTLNDNKLVIDQEYNIIRKLNNDIILKNKEKDFLLEVTKNNPYKKTEINEDIFKKNSFKDIKLLQEVYEIIRYIPNNLKHLIHFILNNKLKIIMVSHSDIISDIDQFLKVNKLGKIRLISNDILENIDLKAKNENINQYLSQEKVLGVANKLVNYPSEFNNLFEILLGQVLIVEDMGSAFNLYKKLKGQWAIASLDGMVIDMSGLIMLNIFSENKETINNLLPEEKIEQLKKEIHFINKEKIEHQGVFDNSKNDNKELTRKTEQLDQQLKKYEHKLSQENNISIEINKTISGLENQIKSLIFKKKSEEKRIQSLIKSIELSKSSINKVEKYIDSFQSFYQYALKIKNLCLKNIDWLKKELENDKMKINWNEERKALMQKRTEEMNHFIQTYNLEENQRQIKINQYKNEKNQLLEQQSILEKKLNEIMQHRKLLDNDRIEFKESTKEQENILKKTHENIETNQDKLEEKKNKYHEVEMNKVQNQEKTNHLLNTIKNQYNSSIDEILLHKNVVNSQKEAYAKISKYKENISSMGQINFDALQEYQNQSDRYHDLQRKKEEIIKSKEKLLNLINRIDRIAEEHFYQTFLKVESNFKEIFQKLFIGGQVSLELTNEKKLLETGIEVMAQPPGKKLQNISLLSTGERSLTAIALLFALWKANPSPFCFFDEIDSALDEANALRLASFLRNEDLKDAQIIIITHQRGVMESADALYGITMEGSGISKLMSVKILDS